MRKAWDRGRAGRVLLLALGLWALAGCRDASLQPVEEGLLVQPAHLAFEEVGVGASARLRLSVRALRGTAAGLVWTAPGGAFRLHEAPGQLAAGGSAQVEVSFTPLEAGPAEAFLEVALAGADAEAPPSRVRLTGTGVAPRPCAAGPCVDARWDPAALACVEVPRADGTACASTCLVGGTCRAGVCRGPARTCDDDNACTEDACVEAEGCVHTPRTCAASGPCTVGVCDAREGCSEVPVVDGTPCGSATCQAAQVCLSGSCQQVVPAEGSPCTLASDSACFRGACADATCQPRLAPDAPAACAPYAFCPLAGLPGPPLVHGKFLAGHGPVLSPLVVADVTGDGRQDVVVHERTSGDLVLLEGHGDGTFTRRTLGLQDTTSALSVDAADVTGDGLLDVVVLVAGSSNGWLLVGRKEGGLQAPRALALDVSVSAAVLGDVDGNGLADLLLRASHGSDWYLLAGHGVEGLLPARKLLFGFYAQSFSLLHLDTDGRPDLFLRVGDGEHSLWRQGPDLTFELVDTPDLPEDVRRVAFGDMDGDGLSDLALWTELRPSSSGTATGGFHLLRGTGKGFTPLLHIPLWQPALMRFGDFDEDGRMDLLGSDRVLLGTADGGFAQRPVSLDETVRAGATGDVDGDGHLDVVITTPFGLHVHPGSGQGTFVTPSVLGTVPGIPVLADFDLDGRPELVVSPKLGRTQQNAGIYLQQGSGSLSLLQLLPQPLTGRPAVGDLDSDGHPDLVFHAADSYQTQLYRAPGTFVAVTSPGAPSSGEPHLAHLDGDGVLDLVSTRPAAAPREVQAWLHRGLGQGRFAEAVALSAVFSTLYGTGDLDADGVDDLLGAGSCEEGRCLQVARGLGDGSVAEPVQHVLSSTPRAATVADVDEDGVLDVLVVGMVLPGPTEWRVDLLRGQRNGPLRPAERIWSMPEDGALATLTTLDVDGDGHLDVAIRLERGGVHVVQGRGDGSFGAPVSWPDGSDNLGLEAGDWDGDGRADLLGGGDVPVVMRNACGARPPSP